MAIISIKLVRLDDGCVVIMDGTVSDAVIDTSTAVSRLDLGDILCSPIKSRLAPQVNLHSPLMRLNPIISPVTLPPNIPLVSFIPQYLGLIMNMYTPPIPSHFLVDLTGYRGLDGKKMCFSTPADIGSVLRRRAYLRSQKDLDFSYIHKDADASDLVMYLLSLGFKMQLSYPVTDGMGTFQKNIGNHSLDRYVVFASDPDTLRVEAIVRSLDQPYADKIKGISFIDIQEHKWGSGSFYCGIVDVVSANPPNVADMPWRDVKLQPALRTRRDPIHGVPVYFESEVMRDPARLGVDPHRCVATGIGLTGTTPYDIATEAWSSLTRTYVADTNSVILVTDPKPIPTFRGYKSPEGLLSGMALILTPGNN